jgi:hypothetical protein
MADGTEPIDPDEIIYRRVPERSSIYKPNRTPALSQKAFSPRDSDVDGISVIRASYVGGAEEAAANGPDGMEFYVLAFRAGDLQASGMSIVPAPEVDCIGHALIPNVNAANRDLPQVQAIMERARASTYLAHGPFPGKKRWPPL